MPSLKVTFIDEADRSVALPSYETNGAAGADIRANLPENIRMSGLLLHPGQRVLVPTGLKFAIPNGFEVQVRPRSGLALKHGLSLANAPGTIDSDYRGPIGVILVNLGEMPYTVNHGERIAQIVIAPVVQAKFELVETLDETSRGSAGFGSTGKD